MRYVLVLLPLFFFVQSCAFFRFNPRSDTEFRKHPLGMSIYNMSGMEISDAEWQRIFSEVAAAHQALKACLKMKGATYKELMTRSIVIIPPEDIFYIDDKTGGFVNLISIFIRKDNVFLFSIRHEWIHMYIFFENPLTLGDPPHWSRKFARCEEKYHRENN